MAGIAGRLADINSAGRGAPARAKRRTPRACYAHADLTSGQIASRHISSNLPIFLAAFAQLRNKMTLP